MTKWKNVVLLINYNYNQHVQKSSAFLQKLYGTTFREVLIYSDVPAPLEYYNKSDPSTHRRLPIHRGFYGYSALIDCFSHHPLFQTTDPSVKNTGETQAEKGEKQEKQEKQEAQKPDGVFFLMDDCLLNCDLLQQLDPGKLICENFDLIIDQLEQAGPIAQKKDHWHWGWNRPRIEKMMHDPEFAQNGGSNLFSGQFSDYCYLPLKYCGPFVALARVFLKHQIFLEIAIPSILRQIVVARSDLLPVSLLPSFSSRESPEVMDRKKEDATVVKQKNSEPVADAETFAQHTNPFFKEWVVWTDPERDKIQTDFSFLACKLQSHLLIHPIKWSSAPLQEFIASFFLSTRKEKKEKTQKKGVVVITTIQAPQPMIRCFEDPSMDARWDVLVVMDKKTPRDPWRKLRNVFVLTPERQERLFPDLSKAIGWNQYARKNIGYLCARQFCLSKAYDMIAELDDDTAPHTNDWISLCCRAADGDAKTQKPLQDWTVHQIEGPEFPNMYQLFTGAPIWPRGFPLDRIQPVDKSHPVIDKSKNLKEQNNNIAILQGLVDGDPDVDAICRLIFPQNIDHKFKNVGTDWFALDSKLRCPFNSQNTFWMDPEIYVLMYLPISCTFRATDIFRSYICQALFLSLGKRLAFAGALATQKRNPHNLLQDFRCEVPIYTEIYSLLETVEAVVAEHPIQPNNESRLTWIQRVLFCVYQKLVEKGIFEKRELSALSLWLAAFS